MKIDATDRRILEQLQRNAEIQVADLALAELLEYDGIVLLEWGDVVAQSLGEHLLVQLVADLDDDDVRHITLSGTGRSWALRWDRLTAAVEAYAC